MKTYVVELDGGYYYISSRSFDYLKSGSGNAWTKLHPPKSLIKTITTYDEEFDEDEIVIDYMNKYGINKVRGGTYNSVELSEYQKRILSSKVVSKEEVNHYKPITNKTNSVLGFNSNEDDFTSVKYNKKSYNTSNASKVYSDCSDSNPPTHVCMYCEMTFYDQSLLNKHENSCKDSYYTKQSGKNNLCLRCGRSNHVKEHCHATTTIHGETIRE